MYKLQFRNFGKRNKLISLLIAFSLISKFALSQEIASNERIEVSKDEMKQIEKVTKLSAEELQLFKQTTEVKINEFQNCIIIIGDKSKPDFDRNKAITSAMQLFIPDAKMQTSVLYPNGETKISTYPIGKYLQRLKGLPFAKVVINFYDIAYLSEFQLGKDNKYYGTATIFQEFKAISKDGNVYTDRTVKTIDIILEYVEDNFFKVKRWTIKLGDIKVVETRKA